MKVNLDCVLSVCLMVTSAIVSTQGTKPIELIEIAAEAPKHIEIFIEDAVVGPKPIEIIEDAVVGPKPIEIIEDAVVGPKPIEIIEDAVVGPKPIEIIEDAVVGPKPIEIIEDAVVAPKPIEIIDNAAGVAGHQIEKRMSKKYIRPCYFTNWAQYRNGRAKYVPEDYISGLCTHIMFAFGWMNEDFTLRAYDLGDLTTPWSKGMYDRVNALKNRDPELKTLLSVGGWSFGTRLFKSMAQSQDSRKIFIDSATQFVRKHGFDGLDIDWEYPQGATEKDNYSKLIKEVRQAFEAESKKTGKDRLLITAAVSAGQGTMANAYNVPELNRWFDFVLVMTYDFHGGWESSTGLNSPLYAAQDEVAWQKVWNTNWAANQWKKLGMDKDKIVIGLASYGRGWTLKDEAENGVGARALSPAKPTKYVSESGVAAYYELCEMLAQGARRVWDTERNVPYLYLGSEWYGYDDEESFRIKMNWLKKEDFGGAFVWTLDFDDFNGKCSNGNGKKYPLISIIAEELGGIKINPDGTTPSMPKTIATTTSSRPTTTPEPMETEPCKGRSDGFYRHPRSCQMFLLCLSDKYYIMSCPDGLEYGPGLGYCAKTREAQCRNLPKPEPTTTTTQMTTTKQIQHTTTTPSSGKIFLCPSNGFHPDPASCGHFYRCHHGSGFRFSCPGHLHFDDKSFVCVNPRIAKCRSDHFNL